MPAYSDPNIFSSGGSISPPRGILALIEARDSDRQPSTIESSDSGLPESPQGDEKMSIGLPSPTASSRSNIFRSPYLQHRRARQFSTDDELEESFRSTDDVPPSPSYLTSSHSEHTSPSHVKFKYTKTHHSPPAMSPSPRHTQNGRTGHDSYVNVSTLGSTVERSPDERRNGYNRLRVRTLEESIEATKVVYDEPNCEYLSDLYPSPSYLHTSPTARAPISSRYFSKAPAHSHGVELQLPLKPAAGSTQYMSGTDTHDREEDYGEMAEPPLPRQLLNRIHGQAAGHQKPTVSSKPVGVQAHQMDIVSRRRNQASSDVSRISSLNTSRERARSCSDEKTASIVSAGSRQSSNSGSERHLEKTSNDYLKRLHEEEERLTKVLAASRKGQTEEFVHVSKRVAELNRPYKLGLDSLDHDYSDPDTIMETCSDLADYHTPKSHLTFLQNKFVTKEVTNNIRGYAYKVQIPYTNTQYDVPRRAAPTPDLATMSHDAPPKPKRHTSSEHLYYINK